MLQSRDKVSLSEHAGARHVARQLFSLQRTDWNQFLSLPAIHKPAECEQWYQNYNLQHAERTSAVTATVME